MQVLLNKSPPKRSLKWVFQPFSLFTLIFQFLKVAIALFILCSKMESTFSLRCGFFNCKHYSLSSASNDKLNTSNTGFHVIDCHVYETLLCCRLLQKIPCWYRANFTFMCILCSGYLLNLYSFLQLDWFWVSDWQTFIPQEMYRMPKTEWLHCQSLVTVFQTCQVQHGLLSVSPSRVSIYMPFLHTSAELTLWMFITPALDLCIFFFSILFSLLLHTLFFHPGHYKEFGVYLTLSTTSSPLKSSL